MHTMAKTLAILILVVLSAGCAGLNSYRLATGPAPFHKFDLPIYATENVPFEYQELGIVRGVGWVSHGWPDQTQCAEAMVNEAKQMGADAVIGVRVVPFTESSGFLIVGCSGVVDIQGVAVKIIRP